MRRERAKLEISAAMIADAIADRFVVPTFTPAPQQTEATSVQELVNVPNGAPEAVYTVAGENPMWPLSVMCRLQTSASVADRTVALEYRNADGRRFLVAGTQAIVQAGQTQSFCWHPQSGSVTWPVEDAAIAPLPQQHLFPGFKLALVIGAAQAGDVLDQVILSVRFDD